MQYHGIASYKFEYQLSTGGDWTTAVDTPNTSTSYAYTIEGLTGGKGYNLKVTVTDNAGNIGTGTDTANTEKPEKNPGGVITDIEMNDFNYPGKKSTAVTNRMCTSVTIEAEPRTVTVGIEEAGIEGTYSSPRNKKLEYFGRR